MTILTVIEIISFHHILIELNRFLAEKGLSRIGK